MKDDSRAVSQLQQTTLSWSSVAIGALLLFVLNLWKESALLTIGFFLIILPSASMTFFNIWLAEVARVMRIGRYLFFLEKKIKVYFADENLLMYEHWLRDKSIEKKRHFKFGHISAIAIYMGILLFSHIVTAVMIWTCNGNVIVSDNIVVLIRPSFWALNYKNHYLLINCFYKFVFTVLIFAVDIWLIFNARKRVKKFVL